MLIALSTAWPYTYATLVVSIVPSSFAMIEQNRSQALILSQGQTVTIIHANTDALYHPTFIAVADHPFRLLLCSCFLLRVLSNNMYHLLLN